MNHRFVKLIYPYKSKDGNLTRISSLKVHLKNKNNAIYDTVDQFENEIGSKIKKTIKEVKKLVLLREIINLHNINGIKSMDQIRTMVKQIKSGKEILSPPGRKYLHEVPHFIVENENGHVNDKEILIFFGIHSKILNDSDWRKYVINWQAPKEGQLCKREQKNMGELFNSISVFYNKNKNYNIVDI